MSIGRALAVAVAMASLLAFPLPTVESAVAAPSHSHAAAPHKSTKAVKPHHPAPHHRLAKKSPHKVHRPATRSRHVHRRPAVD